MQHHKNSYPEGTCSKVVYVPWRVAQKARFMLKAVANTKVKVKTSRSVVFGHRKGVAFIAMHDGRYMYYKELYAVTSQSYDNWECWMTGSGCINVFAKASQTVVCGLDGTYAAANNGVLWCHDRARQDDKWVIRLMGTMEEAPDSGIEYDAAIFKAAMRMIAGPGDPPVIVSPVCGEHRNAQMIKAKRDDEQNTLTECSLVACMESSFDSSLRQDVVSALRNLEAAHLMDEDAEQPYPNDTSKSAIEWILRRVPQSLVKCMQKEIQECERNRSRTTGA